MTSPADNAFLLAWVELKQWCLAYGMCKTLYAQLSQVAGFAGDLSLQLLTHTAPTRAPLKATRGAPV